MTQAYLAKENFPVLPMISQLLVWLPYHRAVGDSWKPALSKRFVAVGSMARVVGSKHQVPLPARGFLVRGKKLTEGGKIAGCRHILAGLGSKAIGMLFQNDNFHII